MAEVDVIASVNGKVVLVEAKVNGAFKAKERGHQTRKLLRIAEALHSDEVVLATSQPAWNELDVAHVTQQAAAVRLTTSVIVDL